MLWKFVENHIKDNLDLARLLALKTMSLPRCFLPLKKIHKSNFKIWNFIVHLKCNSFWIYTFKFSLKFPRMQKTNEVLFWWKICKLHVLWKHLFFSTVIGFLKHPPIWDHEGCSNGCFAVIRGSMICLCQLYIYKSNWIDNVYQCSNYSQMLHV